MGRVKIKYNIWKSCLDAPNNMPELLKHDKNVHQSHRSYGTYKIKLI